MAGNLIKDEKMCEDPIAKLLIPEMEIKSISRKILIARRTGFFQKNQFTPKVL